MKLYEFALAPNPRRVRIFLAEKGIAVPMIQINLREAEQLKPEFLAINPFATVPVLELDDGRRIAETIAICRYFEAAHAEPPLFGRDPYEIGVVEEWQRHVELEGMAAIADGFRNTTPGMKGRAVTGPHGYEQIAALAERGKARATRFFELLDARLAQREFVAGERYSVADITALVAHDFGARTKTISLEHLSNVKRWHAAVSARPSAEA